MSAEQWVFPNSYVERVIDGDTFTAHVGRNVDFGFHVKMLAFSVQRFRLNRCAAAPIKTESGAGAAARLNALLYDSLDPTAVRGFTLTSVGPYKYGDEWMAEVVLDTGRNVSDVLIAEQWAALWDGNGKQPSPSWPRTVTQ
jgi:endonuclease YncB( thermonuclease family)